jgi:hypothetical protein
VSYDSSDSIKIKAKIKLGKTKTRPLPKTQESFYILEWFRKYFLAG